MPGVVRMQDQSTADPCGAPPRPNMQGSPRETANGKPIHCQTHMWMPHACPPPASVPHPAMTTKGNPRVTASGLPVARMGDSIMCGSTCLQCSSDVIA